MGNDVDDALALAMLHALESRGECRLLAVTITKDNPWSAVYVDLVNTFYGRARIPVGSGEGRGDAGGQRDDPAAQRAAPRRRNPGLSAAAGERRRSAGGGRAAAARAGGGARRQRGDDPGWLQHQPGPAAGFPGRCRASQAQGETADRDGGQLRANPSPSSTSRKTPRARRSCSPPGPRRSWPAASRLARNCCSRRRGSSTISPGRRTIRWRRLTATTNRCPTTGRRGT